MATAECAAETPGATEAAAPPPADELRHRDRRFSEPIHEAEAPPLPLDLVRFATVPGVPEEMIRKNLEYHQLVRSQPGVPKALPGTELVPAAALPGYPQVLLGTKVDAAAVFCGGNPWLVGAVVNCARDDWLDQVRRGHCGEAAQAMHGELKSGIAALKEGPDGGVTCGEVLGIRYCTLNARDRDRMDPIIMNGEVAVPGLMAYDMAQHFPGALRFIRECVSQDICVLIHCLRGENRAGAVAGAFLAVDGDLDPEDVANSLRKIRGSGALSNRAFFEQVGEFRKSGGCG